MYSYEIELLGMMDKVESVLSRTSLEMNRGGRVEEGEGLEEHDCGNNNILGNDDSMDNGMEKDQQKEREDKIGSRLPLLNLLWDGGQSGLSPTDAEVVSE